MSPWILLALTTLFYATYNLCVKFSGAEVSGAATTTVTATICLQLAAITVSFTYMAILLIRGGHAFALPTNTYLWAMMAGLAIGGAEVAYFYLFSDLGSSKPLSANIAIPTIVAGTIVITMIVSALVLGEKFGWHQLFGTLLIVSGLALLFAR